MQYAWKYIEEESWLPWLRFTWQNVTLQINYEVSFFLANLKLYMVSNIYLVLFWKLHSRKTPKIMITMTFTVNICNSFQKGVPIFFSLSLTLLDFVLSPLTYLQDINEHRIRLKEKLNERIWNILLLIIYSVMMPLIFKQITSRRTTWQEFQLLEEYIVKFFTKSYFPERFTVTFKCSKMLSAWEEQYLIFLAIYIFSFALPTRLVHRLSS